MRDSASFLLLGEGSHKPSGHCNPFCGLTSSSLWSLAYIIKKYRERREEGRGRAEEGKRGKEVVVWLLSHVWLCDRLYLCDFPYENTGMGCHFLLQGILQTQGSNQHLLHWQADSLPLSHLGSPLCACILGLKQVSKWMVDGRTQISHCWRKKL